MTFWLPQTEVALAQVVEGRWWTIMQRICGALWCITLP